MVNAPTGPAAVAHESIPAKWTPYLQSVARVVFGFLMLRHGMEQLFGFPEASDAGPRSYQGVLEVLAFPGAILMMLGLFTRSLALAFSILHFVMAIVGPLQVSLWTHVTDADHYLLNGLLFLYFAAAGGGAWSLDRVRDPMADDAANNRWAPYSLGLLRLSAGYLFALHGFEKWFGLGGSRPGRPNVTTMVGIGGLIEMTFGSLLALGLFSRAAAFILAGEIAVGYFTFWAPQGFWQSFNNGRKESSILFSFVFLFLWAAGPGRWSLDGWRRKRRQSAVVSAAAVST